MHYWMKFRCFMFAFSLVYTTAVKHQFDDDSEIRSLRSSKFNQPVEEAVNCEDKQYRNEHLAICQSRFKKTSDRLTAGEPLAENAEESVDSPAKSSDAFPAPPPVVYGGDGKTHANGEEEKTKTKTAAFTKVLYIAEFEKAELKDKCEIPMGIMLKEDCDDKLEFTFKDTITKDLAEHFAANCDATNKKMVKMTLVKNFEKSVLQKLGLVVLYLEATNKETKEVQSETVCWMSLITKSEKPEKLTFEKAKYEITSLAEYTGIVDQFVAKMINNLNAIIKYSITIIGSDIKDLLTIDTYTGALRITKSLKPGQYKFNIQAQTADNKYKDNAEVTLTVSHMAVCNTDDLNFIYSLLIVQVPQGKITQNVVTLDKQKDNCVYRMTSQKPTEGYFDFDEKTSSLSLTKEVYRSDSIFGDRKREPKFLIELEVYCKEKSRTKRSNDGQTEDAGKMKNEGTEVDEYFSVLNNPKKLFVEVLIEDEGPLSFPEEELFFGYPQSYNFIEDIPPLTLATVQVDKKNLKKDADIRYAIEDNDCPFSIHPTSGKLYPLKYHKGDDKITFTVIATRMDKDKVEKEAKTKVTVFFLTLKQIVEIHLTNVDITNVDSPLQALKTESDFTLRELSHAVIPRKVDKKRKKSEKNDAEMNKHLTRTVCYAFDSKKHIVLDGDVILEKFKSSPNVDDILVMYDSPPRTPSKSGRGFWLSGLLICIVVFSLIFGIFGTYLFYFRNRNLPFGIIRQNLEGTSTTPLEEDMEGPSQTRWINSSGTNVFSKFNEMHSSTRPQPYTDFRIRSVAFSFNNDDLMLDSTNSYTEMSNPFSTSMSSFKPEVREKLNNPLNTNNFQIESTYDAVAVGQRETSQNIDAQNQNVPVLPVIMLPPVSADRGRRIRTVNNNTGRNTNSDAGTHSENPSSTFSHVLE